MHIEVNNIYGKMSGDVEVVNPYLCISEVKISNLIILTYNISIDDLFESFLSEIKKKLDF